MAAPRSPAAAVETVHVDLPGGRRYPIYIGDGLLDRADLLQGHVPGQNVLVVTNETIAPLYLDRWARSGPRRRCEKARCIQAHTSILVLGSARVL